MDRSTRLSLAALLLVGFTVGTDFTGILLLVPAIENEFSADITTTQWVLNLYVLTCAMFIVAGGRMGDLYGRRRAITPGLAIFVAASVGCALAPTVGLLIGVGARRDRSSPATTPRRRRRSAGRSPTISPTA